jgi:hypothetical protein
VTHLFFQTSLLTDIVLNANPECIPYGILALKNLWKERLQIIVDVFVHSTVVNYPDSAKKFTDEITKRNENVKIPALKVVLIWKDGKLKIYINWIYLSILKISFS